MKIGDYVRTKDGIIGKLQQKDYTYDKKWIIDTLWYDFDEIVDKWTCGVMEWNIIKSSPNIIDLIEEGDYVNGYLVLNVLDFNDNSKILSLEKIYDNKINEEDIESIVTKEEFESMKYEVK